MIFFKRNCFYFLGERDRKVAGSGIDVSERNTKCSHSIHCCFFSPFLLSKYTKAAPVHCGAKQRAGRATWVERGGTHTHTHTHTHIHSFTLAPLNRHDFQAHEPKSSSTQWLELAHTHTHTHSHTQHSAPRCIHWS